MGGGVFFLEVFDNHLIGGIGEYFFIDESVIILIEERVMIFEECFKGEEEFIIFIIGIGVGVSELFMGFHFDNFIGDFLILVFKGDGLSILVFGIKELFFSEEFLGIIVVGDGLDELAL